MTRRDTLAGLAMGVAALALGGCLFRPVHSFRFRVTVEVDTPHGLRSGSSVMEMSLSQGMAVGDSTGVSSRLIGEAVAIDLPGGTLFMLLEDVKARGGIKSNVIRTFFPGVLGPASVDAAKTLSGGSQRGRKAELPREYYPTFASFRDLLQPASIEEIDPDTFWTRSTRQNRIKRVLIEITDQDVTQSLMQRLPWIDDLKGAIIKMPPSFSIEGVPFAGQITQGFLKVGSDS